MKGGNYSPSPQQGRLPTYCVCVMAERGTVRAAMGIGEELPGAMVVEGTTVAEEGAWAVNSTTSLAGLGERLKKD